MKRNGLIMIHTEQIAIDPLDFVRIFLIFHIEMNFMKRKKWIKLKILHLGNEATIANLQFATKPLAINRISFAFCFVFSKSCLIKTKTSSPLGLQIKYPFSPLLICASYAIVIQKSRTYYVSSERFLNERELRADQCDVS